MTSWRQTHFDGPDESDSGVDYPRVLGTPWRADGLWAWSDGTTWYRTAVLGPRVWLSDDHTTPKDEEMDGSFRIFNGRRYWETGAWVLWWTGTMWVLSGGLGSCIAENFYEPPGSVIYNEGTEDYDVFDERLGTGVDDRVLLGSYEDEADADEALADWILANSIYEGDAWYSGGADLDSVMLPRGSLRGTHEGYYCGDRKFTSWSLNGHRLDEGEGPVGTYEEFSRDVDITETADGSPDHAGCPQDAYAFDEVIVTDTPDPAVWIGLPEWEDGAAKIYRMNWEGTRYGAVYHDGTGWVIGTRDSEAGWYTGSEPSKTAPVTFTRQKTETGQYPGEGNLTLTFERYVVGPYKAHMFGDETQTYIAQVGLWL
jgi:hypothetical protein